MSKTVLSAAMAVGAATVPAGIVLAALGRQLIVAPHPVDSGPDPLLREPDMPATSLEISTDDGASLHALAYGPADGELIVLSHGWTCRAEYWYPQINAFADRYRVVVYDQRGHGRSPMGDARAHQSVIGADLLSVLKAVVPEGKRAIIGGHSMGGMSIMALASLAPETVDRYARGVLLASTAPADVLASLAIIPDKMPDCLRPVRRAVGAALATAPVPLPHSPLSRRIAHYVALGDHANAAHVRFCEQMIFDMAAGPRSRWAAMFGHMDVRDGIAALTVPTAVVVGDSDRLTPRHHSDGIADRLRATGHLAEYLVLPDIGHMSTVEAGGEVNNVIERLLSATSDRATVEPDSPAAPG